MSKLPPASALLPRLWLTSTHNPSSFLLILCKQMTNFLSVGNRWRFESVHSRSVSLCSFSPTIEAGTFIGRRFFFGNNGLWTLRMAQTTILSVVSPMPYTHCWFEQISKQTLPLQQILYRTEHHRSAVPAHDLGCSKIWEYKLSHHRQRFHLWKQRSFPLYASERRNRK